MNLRIFDNPEDLSRAALRTVLRSGAKSIAVSGGSTPKRLYDLLSDQLPEDVTWVLVDERFVPHDDPQSNAAMIERTLFTRGIPPGWLHFDTALPDAATAARAFESQWDVDVLDLAILGCGDDGHTASLFPDTPVLEVTDRIATEVFVPRLDQWRVTLTLPVLRAAKLRMVLATGESKRRIIEEVRNGADYPVARATKGVETWWFVA